MRSDAVANQLKVVNAATRLMAEQGLDAELTDIAHEAGVGVGTVYRCVGKTGTK
jgi:AcrR family transcriptional regulator